MIKFEHLDYPKEGQPITMGADKLEVPDNPIIPFIEGDGTGPDIWRASQRVFDSAVQKDLPSYQSPRHAADGGANAFSGTSTTAGQPARSQHFMTFVSSSVQR